MSYIIAKTQKPLGIFSPFEYWKEDHGWTTRSNATEYATQGQAWDVLVDVSDDQDYDSEQEMKRTKIEIVEVEGGK